MVGKAAGNDGVAFHGERFTGSQIWVTVGWLQLTLELPPKFSTVTQIVFRASSVGQTARARGVVERGIVQQAVTVFARGTPS